jgi:hypothetical protein
MWWDNNDIGMAPNNTKVKTTIILVILAQMGQIRTLLALTQSVDFD